MALAIGHLEDEKAVIDLVREIRLPFYLRKPSLSSATHCAAIASPPSGVTVTAQCGCASSSQSGASTTGLPKEQE